LKVIRLTDRREVIRHYLERERQRKPRLASDVSTLNYDDANALDRWLKKHNLKEGVISGFRQWAWAVLEWDDLLDCAVVERLSRGQSVRNLGALVEIGFLNGWEPLTPNPVWHSVIRAGRPLPTSQALIIRPALPSERARFYVEDGSGRAAYLAAHRPEEEVVAYAYIGFDPDPASVWLARHLESGYFVRTAERYRRIEDVLAGVSP
jgi:hypothetical protein